jgi:hypothetical protein
VCARREGEVWWRRRPSGGTRLTRHLLTGLVCAVQDGMTPLHMAALEGHTATVEALLAAGAEVNIQSEVCKFPQPSAHPLTVSATGAATG